ncbi:hypothetical protein HK405_001259, partial [Cladochytrium tenue]
SIAACKNYFKYASGDAEEFDFSFTFKGARAADAPKPASVTSGDASAAPASSFAKKEQLDKVPTAKAADTEDEKGDTAATKKKDDGDAQDESASKFGKFGKPTPNENDSVAPTESKPAEPASGSKATSDDADTDADADAAKSSDDDAHPDFSPLFAVSDGAVALSTVAASSRDCDYLSSRSSDFCAGLPDRVQVDAGDTLTPLADCLAGYDAVVTKCHQSLAVGHGGAGVRRKKAAGGGKAAAARVQPFFFDYTYEAPIALGYEWRRT